MAGYAPVDTTNNFQVDDDDDAGQKGVVNEPGAPPDPRRLAQRQKQLDFGKNTMGYQEYLNKVPKDQRRRKMNRCIDPVTPDVNAAVSKRCFDGQVKAWRRALHTYDPASLEGEDAVRFSEMGASRVAAPAEGEEEAAPGTPTRSLPPPPNAPPASPVSTIAQPQEMATPDSYSNSSRKRAFTDTVNKLDSAPTPTSVRVYKKPNSTSKEQQPGTGNKVKVPSSGRLAFDGTAATGEVGKCDVVGAGQDGRDDLVALMGEGAMESWADMVEEEDIVDEEDQNVERKPTVKA